VGRYLRRDLENACKGRHLDEAVVELRRLAFGLARGTPAALWVFVEESAFFDSDSQRE
jgi:hypothetical protein